MVTGQASEIVQVRLHLRPDLAGTVPTDEMFEVLLTDDTYYLMQQQCPPAERPHIFAIPRANVAAAELWSVNPTPPPPPEVDIPAIFVPRAFCWGNEDVDWFERQATPGP